MRSPRIIAHRGSSHVHHENTMPAFEQAIRDGADAIEFDLRLTRDHNWIVHHDADIMRDGARRRIASMTSDELAGVRVGESGYPVPTLSEFLQWSIRADVPLVFDIKDTSGIEPLVQLIERAGLKREPVLSSFHRTVLKELERLRPHWQRGLIVGDPRSALARRFLFGSILRWSRRHGITSLHMEEHWVTPTVIAAVRKAGLRLAIWTVDNPLRMTLLAALGIDAIITNRPDLALMTLRDTRASGID